MAECFGHRQRRGHQVAPELSFASASTSTGFSRGCASLSPRRPHGSPPTPCPTPPPRRGPERAASGPLPRPDSIRPASSSATLITRPRAAQDSVDVGRRQEEVFVKILLDTSFADDCFSQSLLQRPPQSQFSCLHPCGMETEFPLWSS